MLHAQHLLVMQKGHLVGKMRELVFKLYRTNSLKIASLRNLAGKAWIYDTGNRDSVSCVTGLVGFLLPKYFVCEIKVIVLLSLKAENCF